jgi:hypothetical protein
MSTLEKFIDKVENAIAKFVDSDSDTEDSAVLRLKNEDELLLEELKSFKVAKAGRSLFTCGSVFGLMAFSAFGYAFAWPLPVLAILAVTGIVLGLNVYSLGRINGDLELLAEKHESLLIAMDARRNRQKRLLSASKGESLVLALDAIDEKIHGSGPKVIEARNLVRERVRRIKRDYLFPMINYRERKARYLIGQDPAGLEKEVNETLHKQVELETDFDVESSMILERTLNAKRETLERLAVAEREFNTIELSLDSVFSQVEHLEALINSGGEYIQLEELTLVLDEIEHGLEVSPGVPPKALPEGKNT